MDSTTTKDKWMGLHGTDRNIKIRSCTALGEALVRQRPNAEIDENGYPIT